MSVDRRPSYLRPLPVKEAIPLHPKPSFAMDGNLAIKPQPYFEKPAFVVLKPHEKKYAKAKIEDGVDEDKILRPDFWKGRRRLRVTAMHELGHATVSKRRGWHPSIISIIREGNTLGYVKSTPDTTKGNARLLRDRIALAYGGMMMESRIGHNDHRGASSDMAQAENAANILAVNLGGSPGDYMEEGKEVAKGDINEIDMSTFEDRAEHLMEVGVIAN